MNSKKNFNQKISEFTAKKIAKIAEKSEGSMCCFYLYEPKIPKELKKKK